MDEYFIKRTDERLEHIENKIDKLLAFKWQILGGSAAISIIVTTVLLIIFGK